MVDISVQTVALANKERKKRLPVFFVDVCICQWSKTLVAAIWLFSKSKNEQAIKRSGSKTFSCGQKITAK
jgi:hypothetical protein